MIHGGTVRHYERYADGTVEGTAILAGGMAAIALGFVVLHGEREGGDKT